MKVIHGKDSVFIFNPYSRGHYCLRLCEDIETDKLMEYYYLLKPENPERREGILACEVHVKFGIYSYDKYQEFLKNDNRKEGCWEIFTPGPGLEN